MDSADNSHFSLLLHAAARSGGRQLLFVFATAVLPADATSEQRARFDAGEGGELAPVMCVDKDPHALTTFEALCAESLLAGEPWQVMFAVGLSGRGQIAPTPLQTEEALNAMVEGVRQGSLARYAAYDARGEPLGFY